MNVQAIQSENPPRTSSPTHVSIAIIAGAAVVAMLYVGREVLIPLALSVLLSFLLAPLVTRLCRWKLPNAVAVLLTSLLAFALLGGLITVVAYQFVDLIEQVPSYEKNLSHRIREVRNPWRSSFNKTSKTVEDLTAEWSKNAVGRQSVGNVPKVQVLPPTPDAMQLAKQMLGPVLKPLGAALVIVVLVIFTLLERASLRDRLIALVGAGDLYMTTQALDETSSKVTRYLLMQSIINTAQGIAIAGGLYCIGIPNAILWGALSMVLRFMPYIGPWIAASVPLVLSFAVFNDWLHPLLTFTLYAALELITANFIEPWLYGSGTGVSPLALLVAAAFWTWLWGIPGLLLAVPLTVCLFVAGKYLRPLRVFAVMLGHEPTLEHYERLYQRLLANDRNEAEQILAECRTQMPLPQCLDTTVLPVLQLIERDLVRGVLEVPGHKRVLATLQVAVDALCKREERGETAPAFSASNTQVVCIAANGETDELIASLLARVLAVNGMIADMMPASGLRQHASTAESPKLAWVCTMPPSSLIEARRQCSRARQRFPDATIGLMMWSADRPQHDNMERMRRAGVQRITTLLSRAIQMSVQKIHVAVGVDTRSPLAADVQVAGIAS